MGEIRGGIHAIRALENKKDFTRDSLVAAPYDSYLTKFDILIPPLLKAYDQTPAANPLKAKLSGQIALLRGWDHRWSGGSEPTSLSVHWREEIGREVGDGARKAGMSADDYAARNATPEQLLQALSAASDKLAS